MHIYPLLSDVKLVLHISYQIRKTTCKKITSTSLPTFFANFQEHLLIKTNLCSKVEISL